MPVIQNPIGGGGGGFARLGSALAKRGAASYNRKKEDELVVELLNNPAVTEMLDPRLREGILNAKQGPATAFRGFLQTAERAAAMGKGISPMKWMKAMKLMESGVKPNEAFAKTSINPKEGYELLSRVQMVLGGGKGQKPEVTQKEAVDKIRQIRKDINALKAGSGVSEGMIALLRDAPNGAEILALLQKGDPRARKAAIEAARAAERYYSRFLGDVSMPTVGSDSGASGAPQERPVQQQGAASGAASDLFKKVMQAVMGEE